MQTILAISCSSAHASVACVHHNQLAIAENCEHNQHSEVILKLVKQSLADISLQQVDCIAVDIGPGSFMGIRTAVATAQGLAFAHNIPVYSINSLHLLALSVIADKSPSEKQTIVTALDARRQEWYFASWQIAHDTCIQSLDQNQVLPIQAPLVISPEDEIITNTLNSKDGVLFAGDVWHTEQLSASTNIRYPKADMLAQIAQHNQHLWHAGDLLNPFYVRDNVAN